MYFSDLLTHIILTEKDKIVNILHQLSHPENLPGMARYGIQTRNTLGIPIPKLRKLTKEIGKRNINLNQIAIQTAQKILTKEARSAKWIASDALRELKSEKIQLQLKVKEQK